MRYKLWRLHAAILQEACQTLGITFLPAPPESLTKGFLLPEFYANATHANGLYGAKLITQVKQIAQTKEIVS